MATQVLSTVRNGDDVFIDSNIFIDGLNGRSRIAKRFLERCAREEVTGVTSVEVIGEVTHKLMLAEAISVGAIASEADVPRLKRQPAAVQSLRRYWQQVETILGGNLLVLSLDESRVRRAQGVRNRFGLLTTDSLIFAVMEEHGLTSLASNDGDFSVVPSVTVYRPDDRI